MGQRVGSRLTLDQVPGRVRLENARTAINSENEKRLKDIPRLPIL